MQTEDQGRLSSEDWEVHTRTLTSLPGAEPLVRKYGEVPDFHESMVKELCLTSKSAKLIVSNLYPDIFSSGHILVTFSIGDLIGIDLSEFSLRSDLSALRIRPASDRWKHFYPADQKIGCLEIELIPSFGEGGIIVGRNIEITWTMDRRARKAKQVKHLLGQ